MTRPVVNTGIDKYLETLHRVLLSVVPLHTQPVFENAYFTFFFQISKNVTFYIFLKRRVR